MPTKPLKTLTVKEKSSKMTNLMSSEDGYQTPNFEKIWYNKTVETSEEESDDDGPDIEEEEENDSGATLKNKHIKPEFILTEMTMMEK
jgi:hypothetical protein